MNYLKHYSIYSIYRNRVGYRENMKEMIELKKKREKKRKNKNK